jgi:hypothetical protein
MKLQLVVWFRGVNSPSYFPVGPERGWKVDTTHRQIVVGIGIPRTMIPLDNVLHYEIEEYE